MDLKGALLRLKQEGYQLPWDFKSLINDSDVEVVITRFGSRADVVDVGTGEVLLTVLRY
jgi:hypothetical protein